MKLIKLTSTNNNAPIFINPLFIKRIYTTKTGGSDIDMVSDNEENYHYVKESPEEIVKAIDNNCYRNLTKEEADIYNQWLNAKAQDTGVYIDG